MMKNKILGLLVAVPIIMSSGHAAAFSDVDTNAWYHDAVIEMSDRDIISGYPDNSFRPGESVSRGEAYKIISELGGLDVFQTNESTRGNFHWAYFYSIAIADSGIGSVKASYDEPISRAETALLAIGYVNYLIEDDVVPEISPIPQDGSYFKDIHGEGADFLYESGIIKGIKRAGGVWFEGAKSITRAEFVSTFKRAEDIAKSISSDEAKYAILRDRRQLNIDLEKHTRDTVKMKDFALAMIYMKHHNDESILFKYSEENRDFVMNGYKIREEYMKTMLEAYEVAKGLFPEYFVRENKFHIFSMPMASEGLVIRFQTGKNLTEVQENITMREEFDMETMKIAKEMIDSGSISDKMTQEEIAKQLNKWIVDKLRYDYSYEGESFSGYGALLTDKAVCLGYTSLYNRMLTIFGIDATGVSGKAGREGHIWTEAILDGKKHYIDTTWNDTSRPKNKYFTTSERSFRKGRSWDKELYDDFRKQLGMQKESY